MMELTTVIMAGGKGERFWPRSRSGLPKQFLSFFEGSNTLLQQTVERLLPIVPYERIYVATNTDYVALVREQLPWVPQSNILAEPVGKNTAPCIAYAAAIIGKRYNEAVMLVLPADHMIKDQKRFLEVLERGVRKAEQGENLVTIGIEPQYPETGYGYIHCLRRGIIRGEEEAYPVERFVEKPDYSTAKQYLDSGNYLWNSGMFLWQVRTIENKFAQYQPEIFAGLQTIRQAMDTNKWEGVVDRVFANFPSVSIDYGVMEKSDNIFVLPGDFGWDDVGSWTALDRVHEVDTQGNLLLGDVVAVDTSNSIIMAEGQTIAALGLHDMVVVQTEDALLICPKGKAQDVKKIIGELQSRGKDNLI